MKTFFPFSLALLTAIPADANPSPPSVNAQHLVLPFQVTNGTSTAEIISVDGGIDLPKMTPGVNDTTFDWWHFDVVGSAGSLTVVFYNFGEHSLGVPYPGGPLLVQISGVFGNGTSFYKSAAADEGAMFDSLSFRGFSSSWFGTDGSVYTFSGSPFETPDMPVTLSLYGNEMAVHGDITLAPARRSPPHYPCDLDKPGVTQEVISDVYWSNAVPFADATVDLTIDEEAFEFTGSGYHDKTWGTRPMEEALVTWYRGHGQIGNYTLVWSSVLDKDGKEHFSSWIFQSDGEPVSQSCQEQSLVVRPWGENSAYPPTPGLPAPSGYHICYELEDGRSFVVNFTTEAVHHSTDTYHRVTGCMVGGFEGEEQNSGLGLCEQFQH